MLFPHLQNKKFGYVNLNLLAQEWLAENKITDPQNPLLKPEICQNMVNDIHKKYGLDYSYGGWMEDRSFLWKGSYLENEGTFTHLGIDCNVPEGTEIAAVFTAKVVKIDDDYPEQGGWGPRVILQHATRPLYLIFAHLDKNISCKIGDVLKPGQIFARVGKAPYNGNWFSHLHIQNINQNYYQELEQKNSWNQLDGYGDHNEIGLNASRFPDPTEYLF